MIIDSLKADLAKIASEKKSAEESADKEKSSLSQLKAQLLELEDEFTKIKDTYEARVNDLQNKLKESLEEMDKISKDKQNLLTRYAETVILMILHEFCNETNNTVQITYRHVASGGGGAFFLRSRH